MVERSRAEVEHEVVELLMRGLSRRAIARALGISRNTVRAIERGHERARQRERHTALPVKVKRAKRWSKLDPYRGRVEGLLERFPDITAQRVFEELRSAGYTGGDNIVKALVRELRPAPKPTPSLETPSYGPGEMAECDWSPYVIEFTHAARRKLSAFCYALPYSTRKVFSFHDDETFHSLLDGHVHAFERLEGVAHKCKYDCQKAVVLRWEGNQPIYNPRFVAFAAHYEFSPVACRPRRPNDKPRVERAFWELVRSFFNGREFRDEDDLRGQLLRWMDEVCDQRGRKRTVLERFEEERPHLRRLPRHPYDTARVVYRLCDLRGCIAWDGNLYEVPYEHVTDILPVRVTAEALHVYAPDLRCVASHALRRKGAGERARLPSRERPASTRRGPDLDQLRATYAGLGEPARAFFEGLLLGHPRSAAYQAKKVLALRERYSTADLVLALSHALSYRAFDHQSVERVLVVRARPRRLDEHVSQATARRLAARLGPDGTEPRALDEYDALPCLAGAGATEQGDETSCQKNAAAGENPRPRTPCEPDCSSTPELSGSSGSTTDDSTST